MLYLTSAIIKANSNLSNLFSMPRGFCMCECVCVCVWVSAHKCTWERVCPCACVYAHICICACSACLCTYVAWASLKEPQWQYSWGRSKLLVGRAVTIKGGRPVKTSPVLPGWAKVLLKRFFWGTLNVESDLLHNWDTPRGHPWQPEQSKLPPLSLSLVSFHLTRLARRILQVDIPPT